MIYFVVSFIMMIDICLFRTIRALKRFYIRQFPHFNGILNSTTGFVSIWIFCIIIFAMFVCIDFSFFTKTILSFGISSLFAIIVIVTILFSFWVATPSFCSQSGRCLSHLCMSIYSIAFIMCYPALFCLAVFLLCFCFTQFALVEKAVFSTLAFRKFAQRFNMFASATFFHKYNYITDR